MTNAPATSANRPYPTHQPIDPAMSPQFGALASIPSRKVCCVKGGSITCTARQRERATGPMGEAGAANWATGIDARYKMSEPTHANRQTVDWQAVTPPANTYMTALYATAPSRDKELPSPRRSPLFC